MFSACVLLPAFILGKWSVSVKTFNPSDLLRHQATNICHPLHHLQGPTPSQSTMLSTACALKKELLRDKSCWGAVAFTRSLSSGHGLKKECSWVWHHPDVCQPHKMSLSTLMLARVKRQIWPGSCGTVTAAVWSAGAQRCSFPLKVNTCFLDMAEKAQSGHRWRRGTSAGRNSNVSSGGGQGRKCLVF